MNKILSISIIVAVSFVLPASALAVPTFPPPACSLSAEPGRILVNFPGTKILSTSPTELGPIGAAVPAGTYKVTLMSWDGYLGRGAVNQDYEQWKLDVEDGSGLLASSGAISDLADYVEEASLTEVVNDTSNLLAVPSAGTKVFARHAFIGDPGAHSVAPICAALDPVTSGKIIVKNENEAIVTNEVGTVSNTGGNSADGGDAGNSLNKSGNVIGSGDDNNTTSAGGNSAAGGAGGSVNTGDAFATSVVTNTVNVNRTFISGDCACCGLTKVKNQNGALVWNLVGTGASSGANSTDGGGATVKVKKSGNVKGSDNDENSTSAGGNASVGGTGGTIATGGASAKSKVTNTVNSTVLRVKKL